MRGVWYRGASTPVMKTLFFIQINMLFDVGTNGRHAPTQLGRKAAYEMTAVGTGACIGSGQELASCHEISCACSFPAKVELMGEANGCDAA